MRDALKRFCAEHAVPPKMVMQLEITLDEVISNVIRYAWPEGGLHELSVLMTASAEGIQIEVVDDGKAFDPRTAPAPVRSGPARSREPGGVGIHMVKQLVDDIDYFRSGGHNHVVLTKRRGAMTRQRKN